MHKFFLLLTFLNFWVFAQENPTVVLTTGHNDMVHAMSMSENAQFLASASNNKIIKIWHVATTKEFRTISGTNGRVGELDFSSDGKVLTGKSSSDELYVWDVISGDILHQIPATGGTRGLAFTQDDKQIIYTGESSQVSFLNIATGEVAVVPDVYSTLTITDKENGKTYALGLKGELYKIDNKLRAVEEQYQLFEEFVYPFSRSAISPNGDLIAFGFNDDKLRLFDTKKGKFVYTGKKYASKMIDLRFDEKEPLVYVAQHDGSTKVFNYNSKKIVSEIANEVYSVSCMAKDPRGGTVIIANMDVIRFYDTQTSKVFKTLRGQTQSIENMAYDQKGKFLAVASDKITIDIWDLEKNKVVKNIKGFFPCEFTADGKHLIAMNFMLNLGIFDIESGSQVGELKTDSELIQRLAVSDDGKYLAGGGFMNIVKVWDLESKERVANLNGHTGGIMALDFHPEKNWIASGSHDGTVRIWDYKKEEEIKQFTDQTIVISSVMFSPSGEELASASWDKTIYIRSTNDWFTRLVLEGHTNTITSIDYNHDGTVLASVAGNNAVWEADNSLIFWDLNSGNKICQVADHQAGVNKVIFDKGSTRAFTASTDGTVKYCGYEDCGVVATFVGINNSEFMIYTPDNYYMASKKALNGIAFRIGDKLVPFEQFDIYLNRPDIVTKRIGKSSDKIINAYYYLFKKRLKRLNLEEGNLKLDFNIPKILIETNAELVTSEETQKFWIKAWDDNYNLKQINVYVNDVPVYGELGFQITEEVKSYRKEIEVPLIAGVNKIQFSCLNDKGAESFFETVEMIREDEGGMNNLFIAAIGVSDYADQSFNLKYPTKDVNDFVTSMRASSELYKKIEVKLLLNEEATTENFKSLDAFFEPCSHEDIAMIFIAGHGVLDENFDYYFGTYDMDFNAPKAKGLAYDDIHKLLNKIKSYKKLLIMDTCHSGELDKDEIEQGPDPEVEDGNIEFRGVNGVRTKEGFGNENSVGYLQDVFSDTRKGSGATVIASAGGAEYAMESDDWKNGLFTYCFLSGLRNPKTDLNKNGMVEVSEIRAYVNNLVAQLSGGKQIPSSREENISQDYPIFALE
ncbi:MAG: caspase family protein [Crocinitomicaceae bacterium]|nr:caspase family protein [Crocinitomicaceae bacterium]